MIAGYLIVLGPWLPVLAVLVTVAISWLIMWLMEKPGWRRWCGLAMLAGLSLYVASMVVS